MVKPKAAETLMVALKEEGSSKERTEYIIENSDFETYYDAGKDLFKIIIYTDKIEKQEGKVRVAVLLTDDPTPASATGWVSMGYYAVRVSLLNCKMTNDSPATFEGSLRYFKKDRSSPLR